MSSCSLCHIYTRLKGCSKFQIGLSSPAQLIKIPVWPISTHRPHINFFVYQSDKRVREINPYCHVGVSYVQNHSWVLQYCTNPGTSPSPNFSYKSLSPLTCGSLLTSTCPYRCFPLLPKLPHDVIKLGTSLRNVGIWGQGFQAGQYQVGKLTKPEDLPPSPGD